jgi:hypothetical protein
MLCTRPLALANRHAPIGGHSTARSVIALETMSEMNMMRGAACLRAIMCDPRTPAPLPHAPFPLESVPALPTARGDAQPRPIRCRLI